MIRSLYLFVAMIASTALLPASAQQVSPSDLNRAADQVADVDGINRLMRTCPADTKDTRISGWRTLFNLNGDWSLSSCEADIQTCTDACTSAHNGNACRALARVFESTDIDTYDLARRQSYTLACTLGNASGCTNRGANLRNAISDIDPYSQTAPQTLEACHTRLFAAACADGDAWGCAMEGQAHRLGEGSPIDLETARKRFNKTCAISDGEEGSQTGSAPCRFATRHLEQMDE